MKQYTTRGEMREVVVAGAIAGHPLTHVELFHEDSEMVYDSKLDIHVPIEDVGNY